MSLSERKLLVVGELPERTAPTLPLTKALERYGITSEFSRNREAALPLWRWAQFVREFNVMIGVFYDGPSLYAIRQVAAAAVTCPLIRWWVGSDVLHCLTAPASDRAKQLDAVVAANVVVAPHLAGELASIGIRAAVIPTIMDPNLFNASPPAQLPKGVLIYLPGHRRAFYGEQVLQAVIPHNPDLTFYIVADDTHAFGSFPNVRSLGWSNADLRPVYNEIGCLLRITQHDGLPRMVIESLLRGCYVIYSWPFPGCWYASSVEEVNGKLALFRTMTAPNSAGIEHVRELYATPPESRFATLIEDVCRRTTPVNRMRAAVVAGSAAWRLRF